MKGNFLIAAAISTCLPSLCSSQNDTFPSPTMKAVPKTSHRGSGSSFLPLCQGLCSPPPLQLFSPALLSPAIDALSHGFENVPSPHAFRNSSNQQPRSSSRTHPISCMVLMTKIPRTGSPPLTLLPQLPLFAEPQLLPSVVPASPRLSDPKT